MPDGGVRVWREVPELLPAADRDRLEEADDRGQDEADRAGQPPVVEAEAFRRRERAGVGVDRPGLSGVAAARDVDAEEAAVARDGEHGAVVEVLGDLQAHLLLDRGDRWEVGLLPRVNREVISGLELLACRNPGAVLDAFVPCGDRPRPRLPDREGDEVACGHRSNSFRILAAWRPTIRARTTTPAATAWNQKVPSVCKWSGRLLLRSRDRGAAETSRTARPRSPARRTSQRRRPRGVFTVITGGPRCSPAV